MSSDHLTNRVCIDQTGKEYEWNEMLMKDFGLQVQVGRDKRPGDEERDKAEESNARLIATLATGFDDVDAAELC